MDKKQLNKAEKLAEEVLIYSRNTLLVNLRFLDMALSQFEMLPCEKYRSGHICILLCTVCIVTCL